MTCHFHHRTWYYCLSPRKMPYLDVPVPCRLPPRALQGYLDCGLSSCVSHGSDAVILPNTVGAPCPLQQGLLLKSLGICKPCLCFIYLLLVYPGPNSQGICCKSNISNKQATSSCIKRALREKHSVTRTDVAARNKGLCQCWAVCFWGGLVQREE